MPGEDAENLFDLGAVSPDEEFTQCHSGECRVNLLPTLYRLNHAISNATDLSAPLGMILDVMRTGMRMDRGAVSLLDRRRGRVFIHDSFGLTDEEERRGVYALGEGITGKVVESGKVIIAPRLHESPDFLDRTGAHAGETRRKSAFVCVPIMLGRKVLGAIAGERCYVSRRLLKQDAEFLAAIALMIAPAVELHLIANVERLELERQNRELKDALKERFRPTNIIGNSKAMMADVYALIGKVSKTRATVLILGESGVGKELVASAIHYSSDRAEGPFLRFNCAAIPEALAESQLFGHEKGAFTGATAQRKGSFERADGGTIFLDELGELSPAVQAKLLRVLQDRMVERVGSSRAVEVDVRIIAATNRDLPQMVAEGLFREDLFYRLNVVPVTVPPLRERGSDVILLADHFVARACAAMGKSVKRISTPALNMLMSYHWPGNVRELENAIERAVILSDDEVIHAWNLPPSLQTPSESGTRLGVGLDDRVRTVEHEMIVEAMKTTEGNIGRAAGLLQISRRMLGTRMERHGIDARAFRPRALPPRS
ncbi:sigma 54-interacting transcriptional regulator [Rhodovulum sp. MB263]|uniref:sigma 54-interacting transcriptional regulator n=1 Tax=Rhodovulum sp. (strain MB263) TaxID=308754 RepID=UPI0009B7C124|nr:sigma 54-interacting transcriptional regulator [Rhodovulum sp. MB263]ARC90142.1 sigma-54-dependent Fis family transcriptional regulator [Rhodovulum sp. MB263]